MGVVDVFGSVWSEPLHPGLSLTNPLASVVLMSVQTQMLSMSEDVPTKEGMDVHLEAAVLLNLRTERAVGMYAGVGADYIDTVVKPQFRSVLRSITSGHDTKDLYTTKARAAMGTQLHDDLSTLLERRGLAVQVRASCTPPSGSALSLRPTLTLLHIALRQRVPVPPAPARPPHESLQVHALLYGSKCNCM